MRTSLRFVIGASFIATALIACHQNPRAPDTEPADQQKSARISGFEQMGERLQAMQRDDTQNPAMLWVSGGAQTWQAECASCHQDVSSMRGVAARYPSVQNGQLISLAQKINQCRSQRAGKPTLTREDPNLLGLEMLIGKQSRGLPIAPPQDEAQQREIKQGETLFHQRMGQLDLSCAHCHDERAGMTLGGTRIPQGHATGYPIYRLEWQGIGSIQRRLRTCLTGVRAQPWPSDAIEWVQLEAYLARRARGMAVETPAVRP